MAPGRSPPARPGRPASSTPDPMPSARSPTPSGPIRASGWSCRPWATASARSKSCGPPSTPPTAMWSWPAPRSACAASSAPPARSARPADKEDAMQTLHPQTRENLCRAMRREAYAFATYLLYATQARKHGRPQLADLFEQVANQEYFGHFADQALEAGVIGMEAENLHLAIEEEAFEAEVMYRDFQAQAQAVGDHDAAERFQRLREDERRNRDQSLTVLRNLDPADPAE